MTESNPSTWPPELPLVAILRGLQPERAADVARVLFDAGFRALEVPLNRPGAIAAIATIVPLAPADACIGAGTVLDTAQVDAVGSPGERQLFESAHEQVIYQQGKCDSLLKVLLRHVAQHGCVGHSAARTATHR